jgi:hypothetical protein
MSQKILSTESFHNFFTLVNRNLSYFKFMFRNWAETNYHSNIQTDIKYQLYENIKFGIKPLFLYIKCTFLAFETQSWDCKMITTDKLIWICKEIGVAHFKVWQETIEYPLWKADTLFRWSRNLPFMNHWSLVHVHIIKPYIRSILLQNPSTPMTPKWCNPYRSLTKILYFLALSLSTYPL